MKQFETVLVVTFFSFILLNFGSYYNSASGILSEILFDKQVYQPNDTVHITVVSPDDNKDPNSVESFRVTVTSNTEPNGIAPYVYETGPNTGTFTGVFYLTTESGEKLDTLRVSPGDTITASHATPAYSDPTQYQTSTATATVAQAQQQQQPPPQQASSTITVTTDKPSYTTGDTIHVYGTVTGIVQGQHVTVYLMRPDGVQMPFYAPPFSDGSYGIPITLDPATSRSGAWVVTAQYNGATAQTSFQYTNQAQPQPSTITVRTDKPSYFLGDSVQVSGTISNAVPNAVVDIMILQPTSAPLFGADIQPNPDGSYNYGFTLRPKESIALGMWSVKVQYNGVPAQTVFYVYSQPAQPTKPTGLPFFVKTDKQSYTMSELVHVVGTVTTITPDTYVQIDVFDPRGTTYMDKSVLPDADGAYRFNFLIGANYAVDGIYTVKATYAGQSVQTTFQFAGQTQPLPPTQQTPQQVSTTAITLQTSSNSVSKGSSVTFSGKLIDQNGNGIANKFIEIRQDVKLWFDHTLASAYTNGTGYYSVDWIPGKGGALNIFATFNGDSTYEKSRSIEITLQVSIQPPKTPQTIYITGLPLTVKTDKPSYSGSILSISISGTVPVVAKDNLVTLQLSDPSGTVKETKHADPNMAGHEGLYNSYFVISNFDQSLLYGTYTVLATYNNPSAQSAQTTFQYTKEPLPEPQQTRQPVKNPIPSDSFQGWIPLEFRWNHTPITYTLSIAKNVPSRYSDDPEIALQKLSDALDSVTGGSFVFKQGAVNGRADLHIHLTNPSYTLCQKYGGLTEGHSAPIIRQYIGVWMVIHVGCPFQPYSHEDVQHAVMHEVIHGLGLRHSGGGGTSIMCDRGVMGEPQDCTMIWDPVPQKLELYCLIQLYGTDDFGEPNPEITPDEHCPKDNFFFQGE